jgi:AraC-like DNA-binding protein
MLLQAAGINPKLAALSHTRVHDNQMTLLVQQIWKLLGDEFMGFTETPCKQGSFSFMLHSIRRCENLREALTTGMRFYNLITEDIHTELGIDGANASIVIKFRKPELDGQHFYQDFWMVIWHRTASWLCGVPIPLIETAFAQPRPAHAAELNIMFPSTHHFDATENRLTFSAEHLTAPLIRDKRQVKEFLKSSPRNLLTIPGNDRSLRQRVASLAANSSSGNLKFPSLAQIARELNMSQQTLHRRLQGEATSYQKIKDNVRRDMALTKLMDERQPVGEVAEAVGYSDARSFTRAFKIWTGMTPREYRRYL